MGTLDAPSSQPLEWIYQDDSWFYPSYSDLFGEDIMEDLDENVMSPYQEFDENVMSPYQECIEEDDFTFPPPPPPHQEPQPSTS